MRAKMLVRDDQALVETTSKLLDLRRHFVLLVTRTDEGLEASRGKPLVDLATPVLR